jgi:hypothetical protein
MSRFYLLVNKIRLVKGAFEPSTAAPLAIFGCDGPGPGRRAVHGKEGEDAQGKFVLETRDATDTLKTLTAKHPGLPVVSTSDALFELAKEPIHATPN